MYVCMQKRAYVHLCLLDIQLGPVSPSQYSIIPISHTHPLLPHFLTHPTLRYVFFFLPSVQSSLDCSTVLEKGPFPKMWSKYLRSDQQLLYKSVLCQVSTRMIQYVTKYLIYFNKREIFPITSHPKGAEASCYILLQLNIYFIYFELSEQNTRNRLS